MKTDLFGLDIPRRLAAPALIIVDEAERSGQAVHVGEQIVVVEIGSAVEEYDRPLLTDVAVIQLSIFDRDGPFTRNKLVRQETRAHRAHRAPSDRCWQTLQLYPSTRTNSAQAASGGAIDGVGHMMHEA